MFTKTNNTPQPDVFSSIHTFLSGTSLKEFENSSSWHNMFREQVTNRIDEETFRPLFCSSNGAPNASIRVLIGMMILKEARGMSDSQLFEECRFNLLVRSALGLPNMDDSIPAESTYYLLRKRIIDREKSGNENLIEKVFAQVTKSQALDFEINGKKVRMDSKLIGSNIAWYSRYELIHETARMAYALLKEEGKDLLLSPSEIELLESLLKESGEKVSYRSSKTEIETKLSAMGSVLYKIIKQMSDHPSEAVQTLCRVFTDQYLVNDSIVTVRPKEEIRADSVQSPHDTDCQYRNKGGNQIKGYSINITETCDTDAPLNLITNVQVETAGKADCDFLQPALEAAQEVITGKIETVNTDGAYHSVDNQEYCKVNEIDLIHGTIQGKPSRYALSYNEAGELVITDLETNTVIPYRIIESRKDSTIKYVIQDEKGGSRYFTQKDIDTSLLRKEAAARTPEELNVRNNVEATIFQLGYHYPDDKSRYRGLVKHKIWANLRCLWINLVRITNFMVLKKAEHLQNTKKQPCLILSFFDYCRKAIGNAFSPNILLLIS
jgi:hypothetical protein